jgi:hypothetical protein
LDDDPTEEDEYTYDAESRLIAAPVAGTTYTYDALGNRIAKQSASLTTK